MLFSERDLFFLLLLHILILYITKSGVTVISENNQDKKQKELKGSGVLRVMWPLQILG